MEKREVLIRKVELEEDILIQISDLVKEFEAETGASVMDVKIGILRPTDSTTILDHCNVRIMKGD